MTSKKIAISIMSVLVFASLAYASLLVLAQPVEKVDVAIIFHDRVDEQFLAKNKAEVKHTFKTFPAVSASIPKAALSALDNNPRIKSWEIDQPVFLINNVDSADWGVVRVKADEVWGGSSGALDVTTDVSGQGAKVAVLDTGIDYNHPDLAQRYAGGYDFVNNDNDPMDDHYHGTHCAGTIAATDNEPNALSGSLIGVAPNIFLYGVKVLDSRGSGSITGVAAGIDWAADNGMHIASLSLGASSGSSVLQEAGIRATQMGVLLIAASGNDGQEAIGYPAKYPEFMAIGATDQNNAKASFSNWGPELDLVAPGVNIKSTTPTHLSGGGPFNPKANYDILSGTSMATPHVSGVAALIKSANLALTNAQIRDILTSSATDLGSAGWDKYFGYGLVNAKAAVDSIGGTSPEPDPEPDPEPEPTAPAKVTGLTATAVSTSQIDLVWAANSEDNIAHYKVYRDGVQITTVTTTSYSDTGLAEGTTYTYQVSAVNTDNLEGEKSDQVSATTQTSSATGTMYVYSIDLWVSRSYGPWRDISVRVMVVDENGNALGGVTVTIEVQLPGGSKTTGTGTTDSNGQVTFIVEKVKGGSGTVTATVTNLVKSGYNYDPSLNRETTKSITV